MASSKMVFKPFCVNAEHSKYLTASISLAIACACCWDTGFKLRSFSFWTVAWSSLKSNLVPTKIMGVHGLWWRTSGNHCNDEMLKNIFSMYLIRTVPLIWHFQRTSSWSRKNRWEIYLSVGMTRGVICHNLLGQPCPKVLNWLVCHRPLHLLNSCRICTKKFLIESYSRSFQSLYLHCGNVFTGECICRITNKKASLADSAAMSNS